MSLTSVTPHFSWTEVACHDGTPCPQALQPNARALAQGVLEPLRARLGGMLVVDSWYRTADYNQKIGGAPHSFHLQAMAADVHPADFSQLGNLNTIIEDMIAKGLLPTLGGVGKYSHWTHLDIRPRATGVAIVRWFGKGLGSEVVA